MPDGLQDFLKGVDEWINRSSLRDESATNTGKVSLACILADIDKDEFDYLQGSGDIDADTPFPFLALVRKYVKAQGGLRLWCRHCGDLRYSYDESQCWHCHKFYAEPRKNWFKDGPNG